MRELYCNILGALALFLSALAYIQLHNESMKDETIVPTHYDTLGIEFHQTPNETKFNELLKYWFIIT